MTCIVATIPDKPVADLLALHQAAKHDTCPEGLTFLQDAGTMKVAWATCPRPEWLLETLRMFGHRLPDTAAKAYLAKIVQTSPQLAAAQLPAAVGTALSNRAANGAAALPADLVFSHSEAEGANEVATAAREALQGSVPTALKVVGNELRVAAQATGGAPAFEVETLRQASIFRTLVGDLFV